MSLTEIISRLRSVNEPVPKPARLPSESDVRKIEAELKIIFHSDFRKYLLEASDVVFGTKEPVTICEPKSHTYLPSVVESARAYGVPTDLVPVCEDNADFYCINRHGKIVFWSHNGTSDESWPSLATWIRDVWLGAA